MLASSSRSSCGSPAPMLDLRLFRIRAFTMGNLAGLLAAIGRGGLQFMLIIWLQGIWLPLHGYSYESTPLWAGSTCCRSRSASCWPARCPGRCRTGSGARLRQRRAAGGRGTFVALLVLPVDFTYWQFALVTLFNGIGSGMFGAPNRTAIMNTVPARRPRRRLRRGGHVQNAGLGAVHRGVLLADDRRAVPDPAAGADHRADRARGAGGGRRPGRPAAAGGLDVRGVPGLQPDPDPARADRGARQAAGSRRSDAHRSSSSSRA